MFEPAVDNDRSLASGREPLRVEHFVAQRPIEEIFSGAVGSALYDLAALLNAPVALRDLGLSIEDLDKAAEIATQNPYWNPGPIDRDSIREMLQHAWDGARSDA